MLLISMSISYLDLLSTYDSTAYSSRSSSPPLATLLIVIENALATLLVKFYSTEKPTIVKFTALEVLSNS